MRRIALLSLSLALSGCGYKTWWNPPFTGGGNPNLPVSDSENMRRVMGTAEPVQAITTQPGDIWPSKIENAPTLQDLEKNGGVSQPEAPVPGSPLSRGVSGPAIPPTPSEGSSTPPYNNTAPAQPQIQPAPPLSSYATPAPSGPTNRTGRVVQTPSGPNVVTGGSSGYQTMTAPNGAQSIVVPNGNGTSTVIHADGRIETIPTPK